MPVITNPELLGIAAVLIAMFTAWIKIKPAIKKIEVDQDVTLRADLLARIKHLEKEMDDQRKLHRQEVQEIRAAYETTITALNSRYEVLYKDYEDKLLSFQNKVDEVLTTLVSLTKKPPYKD